MQLFIQSLRIKDRNFEKILTTLVLAHSCQKKAGYLSCTVSIVWKLYFEIVETLKIMSLKSP